MNIIKFRAWGEKKYRFYEGIFNKRPYIERSTFPQYESCPEYIKLDIEQFTGLYDKEGVDIFEGDLIKLDSWEGIQQIKFIEGAFCLAFYGGEHDGEFAGDIHYIHHANISQATVIGNIHEGVKN